MPLAPHPLVGSLLGLAGTWVGGGSGSLPGGETFTWRERFEVGHGGGPALWFRQRTTRPDGSPFHAEDGWLRVPPELQGDDEIHVELAVTSPTGVLEALDGTVAIDDDRLVVEAASTTLAGTSAAAEVLATRRRWTLAGDTLTIAFWMATPRYPDTFHHLTADLTRAAE